MRLSVGSNVHNAQLNLIVVDTARLWNFLIGQIIKLRPHAVDTNALTRQLPKHPLPLNAKQLPGEAPNRLIQKYGSKIVRAN
ncbi:hypothetical protein T08_1129 [Trichinella sp. T8]|nr:hypothetical protein T08_1129 [Trichinella sp. T8]